MSSPMNAPQPFPFRVGDGLLVLVGKIVRCARILVRAQRTGQRGCFRLYLTHVDERDVGGIEVLRDGTRASPQSPTAR